MLPLRKFLGFTLMEVLIVLTLLALLVALLFPVVMSVRESGRIATCSAHLRQIGAAFTLYAHDWNGRLPNFKAGIDPQTGSEGWWPSQLSPYLQKGDGYVASIFSCPTRPQRLSYDMEGAASGRSVVKAYDASRAATAFDGGVAKEETDPLTWGFVAVDIILRLDASAKAVPTNWRDANGQPNWQKQSE